MKNKKSEFFSLALALFMIAHGARAELLANIKVKLISYERATTSVLQTKDGHKYSLPSNELPAGINPAKVGEKFFSMGVMASHLKALNAPQKMARPHSVASAATVKKGRLLQVNTLPSDIFVATDIMDEDSK